MKESLYFVLLIISTIACKQEKGSERVLNQKEELYEGGLNIQETISIPLGNNDFYRSIQTHVVEKDDTVYLYRENRLNKSIDIYNWTAKEKKKKLNFEEVQRFGSSAFFPLSGDSLFIADLDGNVFMAKNDSVMSVKNPLIEDTLLKFYGENAFKPSLVRNEIYISLASRYAQKDSRFKNRPLLASYNIDTAEVTIPNIRYPETFQKNCWSHHQFDVPFSKNNKDQLVFSYQTDPSLYIYDPKKDSVIKEHKDARSKFVDTIEPYKDCDFSDVTSYFKYLKSVARYRSIIYDEHRDIYYRIISLPVENEPDGQRNHDIVMPFSIMVLDKELNVITERKFPANSFDPRDYFVTSKGLWLSSNNEGAEDFNENILSFTLLSLEGRASDNH